VHLTSFSGLSLDFCFKITEGGGSPIGILRILDGERLSFGGDFKSPGVGVSPVTGLTDELSVGVETLGWTVDLGTLGSAVDVEILGWVFLGALTGFAPDEDSNFSSSHFGKTGNVGMKGLVKFGSGESKPAGKGGGGGG